MKAPTQVEGLKALYTRAKIIVSEIHERWSAKQFESKFGIDTAGIDCDPASLGGTGEHLPHANGYESIQHKVFNVRIRAASVDPAHYTFIDYGSGKGRALLLAAEANFQKVIGIEFASRLYELGNRNIALYAIRQPHRLIENLHQDAATFPIPDGEIFLYFYNPFGPTVLRKITRMIAARAAEQDLDCIVAYRNPVHAEVFDELQCLKPITRNNSFPLYRGTSKVTKGH
jgi:hypothetical protein